MSYKFFGTFYLFKNTILLCVLMFSSLKYDKLSYLHCKFQQSYKLKYFSLFHHVKISLVLEQYLPIITNLLKNTEIT